MKNNDSLADMETAFDAVFEQLADYINGLIAQATIPYQLATRLNGEVPSKMEDTRRSLIAMIVERLAVRVENAVSGLKSELRIRYYDERIESKLAARVQVLTWTPWDASLSKCAETAGGALSAAFSVAAILVALDAAEIPTLRPPIYAGSPTWTAVIYSGLAVLSGIAATRPEKIPSLVARERTRAERHVAAYLDAVKSGFLDATSAAETALDSYIKHLQEGSSLVV
jgi:hypothetical protein